jgi:hypothetical protein
MKPRIVRESVYGGGDLREGNAGRAGLFLYWPELCPYTPEQVMKACEVEDLVVRGIPSQFPSGSWTVPVFMLDLPILRPLTPEFIGECEHRCDPLALSAAGHYSKCSKCGTILSDRRHGERRKGERRKIGHQFGGGRRRATYSHHQDEISEERRGDKERRKP